MLSFLLRALSAFGGAASETAVLSIVIEEFPDRLGMASVCLQFVFVYNVQNANRKNQT